MAVITINVTVDVNQQAKITEAVEYATGGSALTNSEVVAVLKKWFVRQLKNEVKSYLADKRRASADDTDIDTIPDV